MFPKESVWSLLFSQAVKEKLFRFFMNMRAPILAFNYMCAAGRSFTTTEKVGAHWKAVPHHKTPNGASSWRTAS